MALKQRIRRNMDLIFLLGSGALASVSLRLRQEQEDRIEKVNLDTMRLQAQRDEARTLLHTLHRSLLDDHALLTSVVNSVVTLPSSTTSAQEASALSIMRDFLIAPFSHPQQQATQRPDLGNHSDSNNDASQKLTDHKRKPSPRII